MIAAIFFYLFAILSVASGAMVITVRNPVHAVLFLILTFFNAAGLFILLGAEFLALLLVIVYVGAVAVLFLFVVMMLDVDFAELKAGFIKNAPVGALVGGVVLAELIALFFVYGFDIGVAGQVETPVPSLGSGLDNTTALGRVIYTKYIFFFQAAGLVLLVAMVGAILLTLHHKEAVKRQSVPVQVARNPETAVEVVEVPSGTAIIPSTEGQGR